MKNKISTKDIVSWIIGVLFLIIGILNIFLVHPVPGIIYILISILFYPPTNVFLKKNLGFSIPFAVKLVMFILIMWPTLGVMDLAEIFGL